MCIKDTCTVEEKRLKDPRRLYAPGRLYHIVERKPFRYTLKLNESYLSLNCLENRDLQDTTLFSDGEDFHQ